VVVCFGSVFFVKNLIVHKINYLDIFGFTDIDYSK